nr:uncharacterized protein LOC129382290 [Dermacentor andersoni]
MYNCLSRDLGAVGDGIEYVMAEILMNPPIKGLRRNSLFNLNVYCSPSYSRARANSLLKRAVRLAGGHPLVVVGDFNTPHRVRGYTHDTPKRRELWQTAMEVDLTLITDKDFPTRRGNSTCRDTTTDLSFVKNVGEVKWVNRALDLRSDHYVMEVSLAIARYRTRKFKLIDWDVFSKMRAERALMAETDFEGWCKGFRGGTVVATKEVVTDLDVEKKDSRLVHLLEAKQAFLTRWKGQKHNRRLRKKASKVNREIEQHCKNLCKQQWEELCESVEGQLRSRKSWGLLKHLLDEASTRCSQRRSLAQAMHLATRSASGEMIVDRLINKYLPVAASSAPTEFPDYAGCAVPELYQDFTAVEIRDVLLSLSVKSAAGPDGVTNRMLRNLDDESVDFLTERINEVWRSGQVVTQWKMACTVLIPKPGKAPGINNLRPIFLTFCVGKVAEHALLNRLKVHIETNDMYTHNMIGCGCNKIRQLPCDVLTRAYIIAV